ncbi:disease resistance protein RPH8A-like [Carex rostrata]
MDAIPFIKEILSKPFLRPFLSDTRDQNLEGIFMGDTEDNKLYTIQLMKRWFGKLGTQRREIFDPSSKCTDWWSYRRMRDDKRNQDFSINNLVSMNYLEHTEVAGELEHKVDIDVVINSLHDIKSMEDLLLPNANSSNRRLTNDEKSVAILLITAIPALRELKDPNKMFRYLLELTTELDNLPEQISQACEGQPEALLLIGSLLSVKPRAYDTWERVKDDLVKIKKLNDELDNLPELISQACEGQPEALVSVMSLLSVKPRPDDTWSRVKDDLLKMKDDLVKIKESKNGASNNHMWRIYTYCYDDLSYFLRACFLYLACYPMNYEIPARSLIEIWIADGFVEEQDGETIEETANKYLEQLVQRSLVWVSKRSNSGAIKYCRVSRQSIHEFCIKKSREDKFLVVNPKEQEMGSRSVHRVAFNNDDKKQHTQGEFNDILDGAYSVLCFDFDMNVSGKNILGQINYPDLDVLELRKCAMPHTFPPDIYFCDLKYLGLRGSNISELPKNIGNNLKTLDVRDTNIKTLPESLWNIKTLRHVYVNPSLQIKGPPSTANIDDMQILKTVTVHESWLKNFPQFLSNLRKLALSNRSNRDNPDPKSNPYWKSISNLLSHMDNLLSMTIIGDIVPSEFVDIRAFPKLKTVKSIKFEGEWICRKLFIDHVKFPPNLVKLTLTKSGLKEDPMSALERLQALKYLSLQGGAYTGMKMICSANGFPQLRFLELLKLENLEIWEVKPMAMSQLTTLRVVQCQKLKNPPNLEHVTDYKVIED